MALRSRLIELSVIIVYSFEIRLTSHKPWVGPCVCYNRSTHRCWFCIRCLKLWGIWQHFWHFLPYSHCAWFMCTVLSDFGENSGPGIWFLDPDFLVGAIFSIWGRFRLIFHWITWRSAIVLPRSIWPTDLESAMCFTPSMTIPTRYGFFCCWYIMWPWCWTLIIHWVTWVTPPLSL